MSWIWHPAPSPWVQCMVTAVFVLVLPLLWMYRRGRSELPGIPLGVVVWGIRVVGAAQSCFAFYRGVGAPAGEMYSVMVRLLGGAVLIVIADTLGRILVGGDLLEEPSSAKVRRWGFTSALGVGLFVFSILMKLGS